MGTPVKRILAIGVRGLVKTRRRGQGFVPHPHSYQLIDGGDVPAKFLGVYDSVAVVIPVAAEAGICHMLVVV